jgi:uncharacterized membrane protein (DUF373 family)
MNAVSVGVCNVFFCLVFDVFVHFIRFVYMVTMYELHPEQYSIPIGSIRHIIVYSTCMLSRLYIIQVLYTTKNRNESNTVSKIIENLFCALIIVCMYRCFTNLTVYLFTNVV